MAEHKTGMLQKPPSPDDLRTIADWFGNQAAHSKEDADHWGHRLRADDRALPASLTWEI